MAMVFLNMVRLSGVDSQWSYTQRWSDVFLIEEKNSQVKSLRILFFPFMIGVLTADSTAASALIAAEIAALLAQYISKVSAANHGSNTPDNVISRTGNIIVTS